MHLRLKIPQNLPELWTRDELDNEFFPGSAHALIVNIRMGTITTL